MHLTLTPIDRPATSAVYTWCELKEGDMTQCATRLRSWALIRGEQILGAPFVLIHGGGRGAVCLPTSGSIVPHPETGVLTVALAPVPAVEVADVAFTDVEALVRDMTGSIELEHGLAGAPEFHPTGEGFTQGRLLWPVHRAHVPQRRKMAIA